MELKGLKVKIDNGVILFDFGTSLEDIRSELDTNTYTFRMQDGTLDGLAETIYNTLNHYQNKNRIEMSFKAV